MLVVVVLLLLSLRPPQPLGRRPPPHEQNVRSADTGHRTVLPEPFEVALSLVRHSELFVAEPRARPAALRVVGLRAARPPTGTEVVGDGDFVKRVASVPRERQKPTSGVGCADEQTRNNSQSALSRYKHKASQYAIFAFGIIYVFRPIGDAYFLLM